MQSTPLADAPAPLPPSVTPLPSHSSPTPPLPHSPTPPTTGPVQDPIDRPLFSTTPPIAPEPSIATDIGGLWYLVNVLLDLDWPERSPAMTPWHQLSALARALLPEVPLDPVWAHLAEIAGDPVPTDLLVEWQTRILTWVRPYLAERLEHPEAIAQYLLEPATLYLTRTHVDVVFSLDQIRLDLRLAGLDRDPGWVPELARAITFHFE